jgi:hypothetical protein
MGGGGNTELLGDIAVAAPGATSDIARATNQGFEDMVAGLAMVFVDRHKKESSHAGRSGGSTALISTEHEQRRSGGPGYAQPTIAVFWIVQEGLSMLAGTG